jgi:hypothetical protein
MGYMSALDMKDHAPLNQALEWHLRGNHYPPLPTALVGACKRAIRRAKAGRWNERVRLPKGMSWRGKYMMAVGEIVGACHLDAFLE